MYNDNDEKTPIMPIFAEISGSLEDDAVELKTEDLPILTLRNMVLFPHVAMPVLKPNASACLSVWLVR